MNIFLFELWNDSTNTTSLRARDFLAVIPVGTGVMAKNFLLLRSNLENGIWFIELLFNILMTNLCDFDL